MHSVYIKGYNTQKDFPNPEYNEKEITKQPDLRTTVYWNPNIVLDKINNTIKFDYFNNAGEGDDSTGLFIDGADPFLPAIDLTGTGVSISSGDVMNVAMTYDGTTLNVTITDTLTSASASQTYAVNIRLKKIIMPLQLNGWKNAASI